MDLIQEARNRGYKKGTPIQYRPHTIDYVEGDYFEIDELGCVLAFAKPPSERKSFDDFTHDTLYNAEKDRWVKIYEPTPITDDTGTELEK